MGPSLLTRGRSPPAEEPPPAKGMAHTATPNRGVAHAEGGCPPCRGGQPLPSSFLLFFFSKFNFFKKKKNQLTWYNFLCGINGVNAT
jgi:hypothetical protein